MKIRLYPTEDVQTAEYFAATTKVPPGADQPRSFTVIEFKIPRDLAQDMGLLKRAPIGQFRQAPFIQPGTSPYEVVLREQYIPTFNQALSEGSITVRRLRIR